MLTEAQIESALLILGLPVRTDVTFQFMGDQQALWRSEIARKALGNLLPEQEANVTAIITQWTAIQYDTDLINAEGLNSSPLRARRRLKVLLANAIGFHPPGWGGPIQIQRG